MREEERQAQRAAARAERRARRAAEQAAQNVPQKAEAPKAPQKAGVPHKKKKINKFRVAVVCTAAVLVALVALGRCAHTHQQYRRRRRTGVLLHRKTAGQRCTGRKHRFRRAYAVFCF